MEAILKTLNLQPADPIMILAGAVLFFMFWKVLEAQVFAPYLKLIELREARTSGAEDSAQAVNQKTEKIIGEIDDRVNQARTAAVTKKLEQIARAKLEANAVIKEAQEKAEEHVRGVNWQMMQNIASVREGAFAEAEALAEAVTEKILNPTHSDAVGNDRDRVQ